MARKVWHVYWDSENRVWYIKRSGRERHREYGTKKQAVEVAKEVAKRNEPSKVVTHKQDGTVGNTRSYG